MLTHIPEKIYRILPFASQIPLKCTALVKPNITKGKIIIKHSLTNFAFTASGHQLTGDHRKTVEQFSTNTLLLVTPKLQPLQRVLPVRHNKENSTNNHHPRHTTRATSFVSVQVLPNRAPFPSAHAPSRAISFPTGKLFALASALPWVSCSCCSVAPLSIKLVTWQSGHRKINDDKMNELTMRMQFSAPHIHTHTCIGNGGTVEMVEIGASS